MRYIQYIINILETIRGLDKEDLGEAIRMLIFFMIHFVVVCLFMSSVIANIETMLSINIKLIPMHYLIFYLIYSVILTNKEAIVLDLIDDVRTPFYMLIKPAIIGVILHLLNLLNTPICFQ